MNHAEFEKRKTALEEKLRVALKVEHSTIPPYLCALYSIEEGTNPAAASVVQTVVMEEMLHMVLVANMLNAIGGETAVNQECWVPSYPGPLPVPKAIRPPFEISLGKFSKDAIVLFMEIEQPEGAIQAFYSEVVKEFEALNGADAKALFSGNPARQVTPEYYYGGAGRIFEIRTLDDVNKAVLEIIDQGEGAPDKIFDADFEVRPAHREKADADGGTERLERYRETTFSGDEEPAHYYRFMELHAGRYFKSHDTPATGPRGPELPIRWNRVYDMGPNPKAGDYAEGSEIHEKLDAFNRCYMRLLDHMQQGFAGRPQLFTEGVTTMVELKQRAVELMRIPSGKDGATVGPGFEYTDDR